jgi:GNAT superfamily N-acetyltransferase
METRDAVTYLLHEGRRILGYYCVSAGSVARTSVTARVGKRRPPAPIPVVLLGRFAIHADHQGRLLGAQLLRHAVLRAVAAGETIGARALLANALNPRARDFYLKWGFEPSPVDDLLVMLHLDDVRALL